MARTGLRMMPTSPSSPLRFRTAGFPQYGSKAGLSDGACLHAAPVKPAPGMPIASWSLHPSFVLSVVLPVVPLRVGQVTRWYTAIRAAIAALPQGPSLRSGLFCPSPSPLSRPHPSHSPARRDFPAQPVIRHAFAVRERLGDPRVVPCFRCAFFPDMPPSTTPESTSTACAQFLRRRRWPSPRYESSALPTLPPSASGGHTISGFPGSLPGLRPSLRPAGLLAPLADLTESETTPPTRAFPSALSPGRSPFPTADIATAATGRAPPAGLSPARTSASIAAPYPAYARDEQRRPPGCIGSQNGSVIS